MGDIGKGMEFLKFADKMTAAQRQAALDVVVPNWMERPGRADSEGGKLYSELIAPISGVVINADGSASRR